MSTHYGHSAMRKLLDNAILKKLHYCPKSFFKLILAGFTLVTLPLIFALIYSAISIDRLAGQSKATVYQAEQIVRGSRVLVDEVASMERSVRLSLILGDASLLQGYFQAHTNFKNTLDSLSALSLSAVQKQLLDDLHSSESKTYQSVEIARSSPEALSHNVGDFAPLLDAARNFLTQGFTPIEHEVNAMQQMADQTRQIVVFQLFALIPLAILLAFGFSVLIVRPIRQIDDAIRHMGQGELSKQVIVDGPQDLKSLGDRLDWMRQRLLELEEQKTRFLQHISHELKTPLTSIREGADLLAEGVVGKLSAKQLHVTKILQSNSVQLQKRIEDILDYSALQTEKSILVGNRVKLRRILDTVLQDQRLAIMNKALQINLDCPELMVECDEQKIRIIVDNLLSNAIKFSPPSAPIDICASLVNNHIYLDVIDTGPGVDPIDKSYIFDAFYQGKRAPLSHIKGTGLGLSIAREYALEHGGSIELVEQENEGAHFRVILPAANSASAA